MREVEKTYDGRESPEWRGELVELLSGVVYDYLRREGLLRAEDKLSEKAKKAIQRAQGIVDRWEAWEEKIILAYQKMLTYTNATMKRTEPSSREFLTLPEVAEYLRLSIHTIYKMAQNGRIPALKAGAVWRFNRAEIDEWMKREAQKQQEKSKGKKQP